MRLEGGLMLLAAVVLMATVASASNDYSGLLGQPYCKQRGCCDGREDNCAQPILGTLCYCDEFCNRTRSEDCCPDYWSHCRGIEPDPEFTVEPCRLKGQIILPGKTAQDNCNTCKCVQMGPNQFELLCEDNPCIVDPVLIENVNAEQDKTGWYASNYSEFWGRKLNDGLTLRLGTLQPHKSVMRMEPIRRIYDPNSLPKNFEAENKWGNQISKIQDQGWCGSSWAISTAAVASDRFAIMSNGEEQVTLSAQHLLSCNNRGQQSCNGGYLDRAWLFLRKFGIVDEACYPYHGKDEKCRIPKRASLLNAHCGPQPAGSKRKEMYRVAPAYRLGNETDIMYEIQQNGPVQATMKVYQDFFSYRNGVYRHSMLSTLHRTAYHSVRIVGWGEDRTTFPPKKYWKVANSWGQHWGENGYFRILRGSNECDIESYVLGAWAQPAMDDNEVAPYRRRG